MFFENFSFMIAATCFPEAPYPLIPGRFNSASSATLRFFFPLSSSSFLGGGSLLYRMASTGKNVLFLSWTEVKLLTACKGGGAPVAFDTVSPLPPCVFFADPEVPLRFWL